jgi:hypothetical protein
MDSALLLEKLIAIERAIGARDTVTLREMVMDAEECLLQMQSEMVKDLHSNRLATRLFKPNRVH